MTASATGRPVGRVGGRVLVLDPDGRVLLIHERIERGEHWLTPGGGVERGELPVQAAVRELLEETGILVQLPEDAEAVLVTRRQWSWRGVTYDQVDHFFVARVDAGVEVVPHSLTAVENETLIGHDWWSVAHLQATTEKIVPAGLGELLARLVGGGG